MKLYAVDEQDCCKTLCASLLLLLSSNDFSHPELLMKHGDGSGDFEQSLFNESVERVLREDFRPF
jgi:hypothetical protein